MMFFFPDQFIGMYFYLLKEIFQYLSATAVIRSEDFLDFFQCVESEQTRNIGHRKKSIIFTRKSHGIPYIIPQNFSKEIPHKLSI